MRKQLSSFVSPPSCGGTKSAPQVIGAKEMFSAALLVPSSAQDSISNSLLPAFPAGLVQKAPGHLLPGVGPL